MSGRELILPILDRGAADGEAESLGTFRAVLVAAVGLPQADS